jgi:excisionase family DNA binding protein
MDQTLTVVELAALMGISKVAVTRRIRRGTLHAVKDGNRWIIARSEADRVLSKIKNGPETVLETSKPASQLELHGVQDENPVSANGSRSDENGPETVLETSETAWQRDLHAAQIENQSMVSKLQVSEIQQEALRERLETVSDTLDSVRSDHDHTRRLLENALDSIGSLTEQMKAQSMLQHQLQQHRALEAPPPEEPAKPGVLARWFGGRRKRHVRIGHA